MEDEGMYGYESANGDGPEVRVPVEMVCRQCDGHGEKRDGLPCMRCEGYGTILVH